MFGKHRVEALSDGVFAIVMTLLVLDLKVPDETAAGHLGMALRHESHAWISFVVTFAIASLFWTFQHKLFDLLERISPQALLPTFVFLGFVSVLPFSTSLWGHHINDRLPVAVYFGNQFLIAAALLTKFEVARAGGHLRMNLEAALMRLRLGFLCAIMGGAMLAAAFIPLQFVWVVPVVLGLLGRRARVAVRKHYAVEATV